MYCDNEKVKHYIYMYSPLGVKDIQGPLKFCDVLSLFRMRVGAHLCNASWRGRQTLNITRAISQTIKSSVNHGRSQNLEFVTVASHGRYFEIKRAGRKQFNTWFSLTGRPTDNVTLDLLLQIASVLPSTTKHVIKIHLGEKSPMIPHWYCG